ncbi:MAG: hypothetical protein A2Y91_03470 [Chloroflexi bacterium RBG_13_54_8]|nr:MAG: hypothetical protein A2Y91_03470 [Chloroflexi bacterium RBG_13_54_8]
MMAIDYTTDEGKVRLLISDTDESDPIFEAAQITAFLSFYSGTSKVKLAAAQALDVMAVNEVMVSKVIHLLDLSTNGAAVAATLKAQAAALREQVENEDYDFDWAEISYDTFTMREIIEKESMRNG